MHEAKAKWGHGFRIALELDKDSTNKLTIFNMTKTRVIDYVPSTVLFVCSNLVDFNFADGQAPGYIRSINYLS